MIRGLFSDRRLLILNDRGGSQRSKKERETIAWAERAFFAFVPSSLVHFWAPGSQINQRGRVKPHRRRRANWSPLPSLNFAWLNTNLLTRGAFRRHVGATKFQTAPSSYLFSEIPAVKILFVFLFFFFPLFLLFSLDARMRLFLDALLAIPLPSRVTTFILRTVRNSSFERVAPNQGA